MKITILFIALISSFAFSHNEDHLWSTDKDAFEYTRNYKQSNKNLKTLTETTLIEVDGSFFAQKLKEFSGAADVTINGRTLNIKERGSKEGIDNSIEFLSNEYEKLGYSVQTQAFGSIFSKGTNFIASKKGNDSSKVIIVSSHIDSVGNAGANDNGTGTIGTLAIAKALASYEFKYDLRILGFDKEEKGLVGSKQYVKSLSQEEKDKIIGVINFEMMGTNSRKDGAFHIIDCDRSDSVFMTSTMENVIGWHKLGLSKVPGCTNRSDHASFWRSNIPAIVISENFFGGDSDKCYHKSCDKFDARLDFSYMEKIATTVASTVYKMLEVVK